MSDTSGRRVAAVVVGAIVLRWGWITAVAPGTSQTLTSPSLAYIAHTQQLQRSTFFGRTVHTATLGVSVAGVPQSSACPCNVTDQMSGPPATETPSVAVCTVRPKKVDRCSCWVWAM